jgi:hypothetical protein
MSLVGSTPTGHPGALAHLGERLPCKQEAVGADPTRSTSFVPVAYARSIRSAEDGESSVQLAGLAPSGNSVMRCIRALGARGLSSILSSPTKDLSVRARED